MTQRSASARRQSTDLGGGDAVAEFVPMACKNHIARKADTDAEAEADPHFPKGVYEGPNPNVTVWRLG